MSAYRIENCRSYKIDDEGELSPLANFAAMIVKETRYLDGVSVKTTLTIEGEQAGEQPEKPDKLSTVEVEAESFANMSWVMPNWGTRAVIHPGSGVKDDLRACIQLRSKPDLKVIYRHMGWAKLQDGRRAYLHAGGAITAKGNDPSVTVQLPHELKNYNLATDVKPMEGARALIDLSFVADPEVSWPLIAAALAPLFGAVDFGIHLTGRTGTFKSEVMSLFQSAFGPGMDARHLPGSWSSTGNALEAQAFYACNAPFVIDDFVPSGTSWQVRSYQQNADKLFRAQGNQSGRARLTDASQMQTTMYPRGVIMSTGEDTPEGHSVRARMLILEISPGDIKPQALTAAQGKRGLYVGAVAGLITFLASQTHHEAAVTKRANELRTKLVEIGHTRTPGMIGRLIATIETFLEWAKAIRAINAAEMADLQKTAVKAIMEAGKKQPQYLEDADPVDQFLGSLRAVLTNGNGHIRTKNGGIPLKPQLLGWSEEGTRGELPMYKSKGPTVGWIDWDEDELHLDANVGFAVVKKQAGAEMTLTKQTLFRRLKDAGKLMRVDEARGRIMVRITADNHPRQVITLRASECLESQEIPNPDADDC